MTQVKKALVAFVVVMFGTSFLFSSCQKAAEDSALVDLKSSDQINWEEETLVGDCLYNFADTIYPFEISMLQFMREEEKLAHDVYTTLYANTRCPFSIIFPIVSKSIWTGFFICWNITIFPIRPFKG